MQDKAKAERLVLLMEEASEVIQDAAKIMRFSDTNFHPISGVSNVESLEKEIGDVLAAIDLLVFAGDVDLDRIEDARKKKHTKVRQWMFYQNFGEAQG